MVRFSPSEVIQYSNQSQFSHHNQTQQLSIRNRKLSEQTGEIYLHIII